MNTLLGRTVTTDFTQIPFDDIEMVGQKRMIHSDLFTVSWLLGRFCNYKCSYCWPYARSDTKDHRDTELCLMTVDEIKRQARGNGFNSFHFSLSGGEPTFHPGYLDILEHLASDEDVNYQSVHMTTNLSRKGPWWDRYLESAKKFDRASITASCHREHVDTKEKLHEFRDKLVYLQDNGIFITINQVMLVDTFWQCWDDAQFFLEKGINVTLKPQSDPTASFVVDGYTPEMLEILHNGCPQTTGNQVELVDSSNKVWEMDQAERFNAFNFNKFKGWECSSGYRSIIIREPDGSIKRSYSCSDTPLGYIDRGFKLFDEPKVCITSSCVSSADSKIPKRKQGTGHILWLKQN